MATKLTEQKLTATKLYMILSMCETIEAKRTILVKKGGAEFEKLLADAVKLLNLTRNISFGEWRIETWFDRSSVNWITQVKHTHRIDDTSEYTGNIDSAAVAHVWAIIETFSKL